MIPRPAFQCHRIIARYWHAFGASCVLLCGVDLRNIAHRLLWLHHVLHVGSFPQEDGSICRRVLLLLTSSIQRAKYLAGIVVSDPSVRTYADIGRKAFGVRSMPLVSFMFCFETFSVGYASLYLIHLLILTCAQCGSCHIVRGFIECYHPCCLTNSIQAAGSRHVCISFLPVFPC